MDAFRVSPAHVTLDHGDVHVWLASVEALLPFVSYYSKILSPEEKKRSDLFRIKSKRSQFLTGRGALRDLLGRYLGADPLSLQISYAPFGRPVLHGFPETQAIAFNVSHSEGKILLAFSKTKEVGVDLEHIRPHRDLVSLARRIFAPEELVQFLSLPCSSWPEAFFSAWTRKEAALKARGKGIFSGIKKMRVSFLPGNKAKFLWFGPGKDHAEGWSLHELDAGPGFKAALAVRSKNPKVSCYFYSPKR